MKIWCQSSGALGTDSAWGPYNDSLKRRIKDVVRPDTVVDLYGTDFTIPGLGRHRAPIAIVQPQAIRNALRAEEQGYDAFIQITTNDAGFSEIREMVNIPVVFITETCLHLASLLADKFAILGANEIILSRITEVAERYNFGHRLVPGGHLGLSGYKGIMDMYHNPEQYIGPVSELVKEIGARGASLIFSTPSAISQWLVDNNLREIDGIAVMDVIGSVLKMAELMVDLKAIGVNRSPRYYSKPDPDVTEALKKVFGV